MTGLDPETNPRGFVKFLVAVGVFVFHGSVGGSPAAAYEKAEQFVTETEKHVGPIKPD